LFLSQVAAENQLHRKMAVQVHQVSEGSAATSECSWYFVIYCVDSTLGMALVLVAHEACIHAAQALLARASQQHSEAAGTDLVVLDSHMNAGNMDSRRSSMCGDASGGYQWVLEYIIECGDYGEPLNVVKWAVQVCLRLFFSDFKVERQQ
jgi:hypothetical protein